MSCSALSDLGSILDCFYGEQQMEWVAGIDDWLFMNEPAVIGLSTRVQFGAIAYMSFTVGELEFGRWQAAFESTNRTAAP